jgi:hypothetical protein
MYTTTVRGNLVDCHVCRVTFTQQQTSEQAHAFAAAHANQHAMVPAAPAPQPVQQVTVQTHPSVAKTDVRHGRWLALDILTCGLSVPAHMKAALREGRKTTYR